MQRLQEVAKAEVFQSLSILRLMPLGASVCRSWIQRDSLFFRSTGSPWWSWSTTTTLKSLRVWPSEQKWAATGFSLVFFRMSDRWLFMRSCSACSVSPTYCFPQRLQAMTYTRSEDLHVAETWSLMTSPVEWLLTSETSWRAGQVLQPRPLHFWLPRTMSVRFGRETSALTKRSRRFFGRRNATLCLSGMACWRWLVFKIFLLSSKIRWRRGRFGWYVATSGTMSSSSFGLWVSASVRGTDLARSAASLVADAE